MLIPSPETSLFINFSTTPIRSVVMIAFLINPLPMRYQNFHSLLKINEPYYTTRFISFPRATAQFIYCVLSFGRFLLLIRFYYLADAFEMFPLSFLSTFALQQDY